MTLADRARTIGQQINDTAGALLGPELNAGIAEFVGWPFVVSAGRVEDSIGKMTAHFACVVHTAGNGSLTSDVIPANNAAVVIDVIENMGIDEFREAHERIAEAKRLQKSPAPNLKKHRSCDSDSDADFCAAVHSLTGSLGGRTSASE